MKNLKVFLLTIMALVSIFVLTGCTENVVGSWKTEISISDFEEDPYIKNAKGSIILNFRENGTTSITFKGNISIDDDSDEPMTVCFTVKVPGTYRIDRGYIKSEWNFNNAYTNIDDVRLSSGLESLQENSDPDGFFNSIISLHKENIKEDLSKYIRAEDFLEGKNVEKIVKVTEDKLVLEDDEGECTYYRVN